MANGINQATLIGRMGQDPEIRYTPGGDAVANISLATSESWKDKQTGEKQERTEWHRVTMFGKVAEIVGQYCNKGTMLYVEGKLRTRKWQGQDGQDRYTTEILVDRGGVIQILSGGITGQQQSPAQQRPAQSQQRQPVQQQQPAAGFDDFDDQEIPF